jgi:uncharacterized membrane protein
MESRIKVAGHPLHPMLIVFPLGLLATAIAFDIAALGNARMGLNTWAAFYGTDQNAEVAGDVAMLANEVTPVLKALRSNHLNVVAVLNDMVGTNPTIYFLHYWGRGSAERLAAGFKAALDQLGKSSRPLAFDLLSRQA